MGFRDWLEASFATRRSFITFSSPDLTIRSEFNADQVPYGPNQRAIVAKRVAPVAIAPVRNSRDSANRRPDKFRRSVVCRFSGWRRSTFRWWCSFELTLLYTFSSATRFTVVLLLSPTRMQHSADLPEVDLIGRFNGLRSRKGSHEARHRPHYDEAPHTASERLDFGHGRGLNSSLADHEAVGQADGSNRLRAGTINRRVRAGPACLTASRFQARGDLLRQLIGVRLCHGGLHRNASNLEILGRQEIPRRGRLCSCDLCRGKAVQGLCSEWCFAL